MATYICSTENIEYIVKIVSNNEIKNINITKDGIYSVKYLKNGHIISETGKITGVFKCTDVPNSEYILLDISNDNSNRKERIYLYQIKDILDITPNNAYKIALDHGFEGTIEEWFESMRGMSAYEYAVKHGFEGTEEEWLEHMRGMSAYEYAVKYGFKGTEEEWMAANGDVTIIKNKVDDIIDHLTWKTTM